MNLHTKAAVIDRCDVLVGSLNIDPRSAVLNTEIGLLVRCPELGAHVTAFIEGGMAPAMVYRTLLNDDRLAWRAETHGPATHGEPGVSRWRLLLVRLLALLSVEKQV